ncbi:MAG: MraY family glycosyltransferase [Sulfurimonas sp.]|nr:MraY family glycosyltransferase [Sulfurimonas sp.]
MNFIFVIILSYLLVLLVIKYAYSLKLLDIPNERSSHNYIVPSGGGIGFVSAFFISTFFFETELFLEYWYIFASIFMVFVVGILDDRHDVSPKLKFLVIALAVFVLWLFDMTISSIGIFLGYDLSLAWFALPFTIFALTGFTNALNLIDGLDGLSSGISVVIIACFAYIGYVNGDDVMLLISLYTIASLVGFMILNWNPAKVFMGDSGSLTLGFIISILAVLSLKYVHPVVILYIAAIPLLDTLVVMIRRVRRGRSPFSADKTHLHHILVKFFDDSVKRTVVFLVLLQVTFTSFGYLLSILIAQHPNGLMPIFSLVNFAVIFLLSYMIFTGIKKRQNKLDKVDL